jgi:GTPase KRas protein
MAAGIHEEQKAWLEQRSKVKVAVIGDGGVGKSCIVQRYLQNTFDQTYNPTLEQTWETDVRLSTDTTSTVNLHFSITDTAGQEDFASIRDTAILNNDIFLVVFSLIDLKTLNGAESLIEAVERCQADKPAPELFPGDGPETVSVPDVGRFVLAGNKCDLVKERVVTKADADQVGRQHKGKVIETSAKSGDGVQELFQALGQLWFDLNPRLGKGKHKSRSGGGGGAGEKKESCCEVA